MLFRLAIAACLLALPAHADVWTFATPSNNIQCIVGEGPQGADLTCTIYKRSQPLANLPTCPAARGLTLSMRNRGGVEAKCTPASQNPSAMQDVAGYGVRGEFGGFSCLSSRKGLDCRNEDGRGFFLSRGRQQIY